jgi:hypothetical protein
MAGSRNGKPKRYAGPPDVMGPAEIAVRFDVTTQLVNQWRKAQTFPQPRELSCGRVWATADILKWAKTYRPDLITTQGGTK